MQIRITSSPSENVIGLNLVGMGIVGAFHPYIRIAGNPLQEWFLFMVAHLGIAAAIYGVYALIFRKRGREGWPKSFLMLAWLLIVFSMLSGYGVTRGRPQPQAAVTVPVQSHRSQIDRFLDDAPPSQSAPEPVHRSQIDRFLDDAPQSK